MTNLDLRLAGCGIVVEDFAKTTFLKKISGNHMFSANGENQDLNSLLKHNIISVYLENDELIVKRHDCTPRSIADAAKVYIHDFLKRNKIVVRYSNKCERFNHSSS